MTNLGRIIFYRNEGDGKIMKPRINAIMELHGPLTLQEINIIQQLKREEGCTHMEWQIDGQTPYIKSLEEV